ncbi:unnamed protein product [Amoebophrya sp. A25]|nr:unnamed protein product [Amoebophrya sp. A25]|eukprot:GSA25T00001050001.1
MDALDAFVNASSDVSISTNNNNGNFCHGFVHQRPHTDVAIAGGHHQHAIDGIRNLSSDYSSGTTAGQGQQRDRILRQNVSAIDQASLLRFATAATRPPPDLLDSNAARSVAAVLHTLDHRLDELISSQPGPRSQRLQAHVWEGPESSLSAQPSGSFPRDQNVAVDLDARDDHRENDYTHHGTRSAVTTTTRRVAAGQPLQAFVWEQPNHDDRTVSTSSIQEGTVLSRNAACDGPTIASSAVGPGTAATSVRSPPVATGRRQRGSLEEDFGGQSLDQIFARRRADTNARTRYAARPVQESEQRQEGIDGQRQAQATFVGNAESFSSITRVRGTTQPTTSRTQVPEAGSTVDLMDADRRPSDFYHDPEMTIGVGQYDNHYRPSVVSNSSRRRTTRPSRHHPNPSSISGLGSTDPQAPDYNPYLALSGVVDSSLPGGVAVIDVMLGGTVNDYDVSRNYIEHNADVDESHLHLNESGRHQRGRPQPARGFRQRATVDDFGGALDDILVQPSGSSRRLGASRLGSSDANETDEYNAESGGAGGSAVVQNMQASRATNEDFGGSLEDILPRRVKKPRSKSASTAGAGAKKKVDKIRSVILRKTNRDLLGEDCAFCLGEFEALQNVQILPCSHVFHTACWRKHCIHSLKQAKMDPSVRCPLCRGDVTHLVPK